MITMLTFIEQIDIESTMPWNKPYYPVSASLCTLKMSDSCDSSDSSDSSDNIDSIDSSVSSDSSYQTTFWLRFCD